MNSYLIVGGGGMIGQKIATMLDGEADSIPGGTELALFDLSVPDRSGISAGAILGSLDDDEVISKLAATRPDTVFQLAAILSGESERDFDKGWRINLFANWKLLEALRREHVKSGGEYRPRFVFASSAAVYGPPIDGAVDDLRICEPQTSYGAQKVAAELMVSDFSRKGFIDGISLRLPTITVRPGKPNAAASSCFSAIIREPLNGRRTALPLSTDVRHMHASPRSAARFFLHAARLNTDRLDGRRALNMPSITCSVEEQIEALRSVAGNMAVSLIDMKPDPFIQSIIASWAEEFRTDRARTLGFEVETSFDEVVQVYIEDDLPGGPGSPHVNPS